MLLKPFQTDKKNTKVLENINTNIVLTIINQSEANFANTINLFREEAEKLDKDLYTQFYIELRKKLIHVDPTPFKVENSLPGKYDNKKTKNSTAEENKDNLGRRKKIELSEEKRNQINATLLRDFGLKLEDLNPKTFRNGRGKNKSNTNIINEHTLIKNERIKSGSCCPKCNKGRMYIIENGRKDTVLSKIKETFIKKIRHLETLRCNCCDYRNSAQAPQSPGESNGYSAEVRAGFAVDTADGIPAARQEKRFQDAGIDISRKNINLSNQEFGESLEGVIRCMEKEVANSDLISGDGTSFSVLEVEQRKLDPNYKPGTKKNPADRSSSRGSTIIGMDTNFKINAILYYIDEMHPGEHLEMIFNQRTKNSKPIYMSDMQSSQVDISAYKISADEATNPYYRAGCLDHLMVKLKSVLPNFPEAQTFIEELQIVYYLDEVAKKSNFSVQKRFELHQTYSEPIMNKLFILANNLLPKKTKKSSTGLEMTQSPPSTSANPKVEPNSPFGQVLKYFLKNFFAFIQFCKKEGCPLSNAHCERANKRIIIYRKNSYIFHILRSAREHANIFSIYATARELGLNTEDYILTLLQNEDDIKKNPHLWTPLAYLSRLKSTGPPPASKINSLYKPFQSAVFESTA